MQDDECNEIYQLLSTLISEAGLQWVTNQVDDTIALGRLVNNPIKEIGSPQGVTYEILSTTSNSSRIGSSSKSKYIQRIESYTGCERLIILLNALEIAIVKSDELEDSVLKLISQEQQDITVEFIPERRNDIGFTLNKGNTAKLSPFRLILLDKISLLRKSIDAS